MAADLTTINGESRFLQLVDEVTWGTVPGSPTWIDVPVADFNVRNKPKRRNGQARIGIYQNAYGANNSAMPSGNLVVPLYGFVPTGLTSKSLAQYLMEWGFLDQEVKFPRSKASQWEYVAHEDDKGYTGLRVNTATIEGSESGIVLTLELMGQTATNFTGTATPPTNRNKLVEFLFEDCTFTLGGTAMPISNFKWSVTRKLNPIYMNSKSIQSLAKTNWAETFSVTPLKADATYDNARDALGMQEYVGVLTLKGLHNGTATGTWAQCATTFNRLSLIDSDEAGGTSAQMNPLTFDVLKPDTSTNGSAMVWSFV